MQRQTAQFIASISAWMTLIPAFPLRSGRNWQPVTFPLRAAAHIRRSPYTVTASRSFGLKGLAP